jgi:hypothetical protein
MADPAGGGEVKPQRLVFTAALAAACVLGPRARADLRGPYAADPNTLHLYHLDDSSVPAADAGNANLPLQGLLNNATLGSASLAGFGTALNTSNSGATNDRPILLAAPALANGAGDDAAFSHANATTGAFTMEALVKFAYNPAAGGIGRNNSLQIVSMDGDGTLDRIFQLRIDPIGFASAGSDVTRNRLEFINIRQAAAGQVENLVVNLPDTGPNAPDADSWFHVAVTYDGNEGAANNLSYYFTKVDPSATQANLVGQLTMARDLTAASGDFAIGNEARAQATDNFVGLVDEVRISDVARAADQFIFVPEPATLSLLVPATLLLFRRRTAQQRPS